MQTFTRFYGKVACLGTISDFSTSLRFLFYELISRFQILISVISPRAYEISPSVGPLGHTHLLTILYADQQSINKVPKIWGQLNEKGNGSSPDPFLTRLRRALRKRVWLARLCQTRLALNFTPVCTVANSAYISKDRGTTQVS